jgi:2'-phosphotransferase
MRRSSQVFIYINVQKAIDAGIKFFLSDNGVVLTPGNESGFLKPEFFERVITAKGEILLPKSTTPDNGVAQAVAQGSNQDCP